MVNKQLLMFLKQGFASVDPAVLMGVGTSSSLHVS